MRGVSSSRKGVANAVGRQIRELRMQHELTQTELARQIGIQQSDLSRMEKGEYRVPLDVLFRILGLLKVSFTDFFGDTDSVSLTPREAKLLRSFRALGEDGQRAVEEFVSFQQFREQEFEEA